MPCSTIGLEPKYPGMQSRIMTAAVVFAVLAGVAAPLGAQTLADLARQEESRRKDVRQPAKVYTNKDLGNVPPPSAPAPATEAAKPPTPAAGDAAGKDSKAAAPADAKDTSAVKDQAYWSGRMKGLRDTLDRDQTYAEALQTRVNALTADFSARDDPAQRTVISQDRQKALAEIDRLTIAIQGHKKAIADLEEEARRASVPPGWLR